MVSIPSSSWSFLRALAIRSTLASRRTLVCAAALLSSASYAQIQFSDFSNPTGLTTLGTAQFLATSLRLVPASGHAAGAAWYSDHKVRVVDGFETSFTFRIIGGEGADGMAFVLQDASPAAIGGDGGDLGYEGIPRSIAVEIDTWRNSGEPYAEHLAVHTKGVLPNSTGVDGMLAITHWPVYLRGSAPHTLRVRYVPGTLSVFVDAAADPALSVPLTLTDIAGASIADANGEMWAGFTAATGLYTDNHDVLSWYLTSSTCPSITSQPADATTCPGQTVALNITTSRSTVTYQWRRGEVVLADGPTGNGSTISGATTSALSIANARPEDSGQYACTVSSSCAPISSNTASVTVAPDAPTITLQPQPASPCSRSSATFRIEAHAASGPLTYQWRRNATPLNDSTGAVAGATTPTLILSNVSGSSAGTFDCVVSSPCASTTSEPASLTICVADTDDGSGTGACDAGVTIDDFLYYFSIFFAGDIAADTDDGSGSGTPDAGVTIDDLLYFLSRFELGC